MSDATPPMPHSTPLLVGVGRWFEDNAVLIVFVLVALAIRLHWNLEVHPPGDYIYSDMNGYVRRADGIYDLWQREQGVRAPREERVVLGRRPRIAHEPIGAGDVPVHVRVDVVAGRVHHEVPVQPHDQRPEQHDEVPAMTDDPVERASHARRTRAGGRVGRQGVDQRAMG